MSEEKEEKAKVEKEKGVQPLDAILTELGIANHDLVEISKEQLTHRMVAKGRKGRRLTLKARNKILNALNILSEEKKFLMKDLFNYKG